MTMQHPTQPNKPIQANKQLTTPWRTAHRAAKLALLGLAAAVLVACGGGGGASAPTDNPQTSSDIQTRSDVLTLTAAESSGIDSLGATTQAGVSVLKLQNSASVALKTVQVGSKILIPPGVDASAPLGMAVVVESSSVNAQGETELSVRPAKLMEVAQQMDIQLDDIPLAAENFVGAIAPSAYGGTGQLTGVQTGLLSKQVSSLNGALKLTPSKMSTADKLMTGLVEVGIKQDGTIEFKPEPIKLSKFLADDDIEPSKSQPFGKNTELELSVAVTIKDLKLKQPHIGTDDKTVNKLNYVVSGKMSSEAKLSGGQTMTLGSFNRAWKDVEEAGSNIKLIGLSSDDKLGKIPLVGLVFSIECPPSKPCAYGGNTQTPVRKAKAGGVVFWVMMNMKGELSLDGAVGVRSNIDFEFGTKTDDNGDLDAVGIFKKPDSAGSANYLEFPFVEGELKGSPTVGVSAEMDAFFGGVRFFNFSAAGLGKPEFSVKAEPALAWVLPAPGEEFQWTGNACLTTKVGGGLLVSAAFKIGAEVKFNSKWFSRGAVGTSVEYAHQYPSEEDMALPGWHGGWYTARSSSICLPQPVLTSAVVDRLPGGNWRWQVSGNHLPTDLSLGVHGSLPVCVGSPALTENPSIGNNFGKAVFECVPLYSTPVADFSYGFTSASASNVNTTALSGSWKAGSAQINTSVSNWSVGSSFSVWLTGAVEAIKGVFVEIGDGVARQFKEVRAGVSIAADFVGGWVTPGRKTVTATYIDANGNTLGTGKLDVTVQPGTVTTTADITQVFNDNTTPNSTIAKDSTTTDTTPKITGTVSAALGQLEQLRVYDNGSGNHIGTATVAADKTWSLLLPTTTPLASGSHSLSAAVWHLGYSVSGPSSTLWPFTVLAETAPVGADNSIVVSWDYGSLGTPILGRGTNPRTVAITAGVEIEGFVNGPMFDVDVSIDKVRLFNFRSYAGAPGSAVFDSSAFNGLVLRVPSGTSWTFSSGNVGAANTLSGLTASRLDAQAQRLAINLAGLGYGASTVVEVTYTRGSSTPVSASKLPHTGITASQCYAAGSNTLELCTGTGPQALNAQQDGHRAGINAMSYSKVGFNGEALASSASSWCAVKDNVTGLLWQNHQGTPDAYTNYGDNSADDASKYAADNATLCGQSDWRLPTADELQTIVDYSKPYPGPTINTTWFSNTPGYAYWALWPFVGNSGGAWYVDFSNGYVSGDSLDRYYHVRLVRAIQ